VSAVTPNAVVSHDGSAKYKTVQEAINAAPHNATATNRWVILIKSGTYKEQIHITKDKHFVTLIGESQTILTDGLYASLKDKNGKEIGTFSTETVFVEADDFTAESITFQNSAGQVGQALAIRVDGDRAIFRKCRFLGWQDTILVNKGRHYFQECYIEGHVDYIFGAGTSFFDQCHIHSLKDGYITAASTPQEAHYGLVFSHCKIDGQPNVHSYLGRPWRDYAAVTFIYSEMSEVVRPVGWFNWDRPESEKTSRYYEYGNTGAGANTQTRVKWAHTLTKSEADAITPAKVLGFNP